MGPNIASLTSTSKAFNNKQDAQPDTGTSKYRVKPSHEPRDCSRWGEDPLPLLLPLVNEGGTAVSNADGWNYCLLGAPLELRGHAVVSDLACEYPQVFPRELSFSYGIFVKGVKFAFAD